LPRFVRHDKYMSINHRFFDEPRTDAG
jgi:hypothetical protein